MMWHFYEIPYIPDLELVKYQSLGEQGIDGILERHKHRCTRGTNEIK